MRKWVHNPLAIGITIAITVLAWLALRPREPVYEGRRLSYWLQGYLPYPDNVPKEVSEQKANDAMSAIGTNAIPTLLRLLRSRDSALTLKWFSLLDWLDKNYAFKIHYNRDMDRLIEAWLGFKELGANGALAVPALIKIYEQNISDDSRWGAAYSLGAIGPPAKIAVPKLLKWLAAKPESVDLLEPLGDIHADPDLVVPVMIEYLTHRWPLARRLASQGLGAFGAEAKEAVPAVVELLNDPDEGVRRAAGNALLQIDPEAAARAGVK